MDIRQAQAALVKWGATDGRGKLDPSDYAAPRDVDGIVGPRTRRATVSFQRAKALRQTGTFDAPTSAALAPYAPTPSELPPGGPPAIASRDGWARDIITRTWPARVERTLAGLQAAQAIARFEGGYGMAWKGAMVGSNNWGAVQCAGTAGHGTPEKPCPPGCRPYEDSYPTAKGNVPYKVCFREYPTPEAGAADFLRVLLVQRPSVARVINSGDADKIAAAMYDTKYFGGFGATREKRIDGYANAIARNAEQVAGNLRERVSVRRAAAISIVGALPISGCPGGPSTPIATLPLALMMMALLRWFA